MGRHFRNLLAYEGVLGLCGPALRQSRALGGSGHRAVTIARRATMRRTAASLLRHSGIGGGGGGSGEASRRRSPTRSSAHSPRSLSGRRGGQAAKGSCASSLAAAARCAGGGVLSFVSLTSAVSTCYLQVLRRQRVSGQRRRRRVLPGESPRLLPLSYWLLHLDCRPPVCCIACALSQTNIQEMGDGIPFPSKKLQCGKEHPALPIEFRWCLVTHRGGYALQLSRFV